MTRPPSTPADPPADPAAPATVSADPAAGSVVPAAGSADRSAASADRAAASADPVAPATVSSDPSAEAAPARSRHSAGRAPNPSRWNLVVPGLLVVALALLVVGLITSAPTWLAASLVASVLAAVLLVVERLVQRRRTPEVAAAPDPEPSAPAVPAADAPVDLDAPAIDPDDPNAVWVVDGRPRYHRRDCATLASLTAEPIPREQALEDGFTACSLCEPGVERAPATA